MMNFCSIESNQGEPKCNCETCRCFNKQVNITKSECNKVVQASMEISSLHNLDYKIAIN